ncbi:MAG: prolyl oligopeptidase family serine peptidase [Planctomycetaceae bacterium]|nr:prolyl oligopeptidase family serine peptidase [Planctomycetaceae bacterium]
MLFLSPFLDLCEITNMPRYKLILKTIFTALLCYFPLQSNLAQKKVKVLITSTVDQTQQPCYVILPRGYEKSNDVDKRPLLISLHSWSAGLEQVKPELEKQAAKLGWIYVFPHFRGPNQTPAACGSELAQQDILDAVIWAKQNYRIDHSRIYLTGASGGGHMTMLMVSRHPEVWTAASAWVGISDLAAWYALHEKSRYGAMLRKSCGGAPGDSAQVDAQYRQRSPLPFLKNSSKVPLDIAAGIHDGHTGSVPIFHSLLAFNEIAKATGDRLITANEIKQLSIPQGRLKNPLPLDQEQDTALGREIYLRRYAGQSRVTIFEGGHEGITAAALDWLKRFHRLEDGNIYDGSKQK